MISTLGAPVHALLPLTCPSDLTTSPTRTPASLQSHPDASAHALAVVSLEEWNAGVHMMRESDDPVMMDSDYHVMTDSVPPAMVGGAGVYSFAAVPASTPAHAGEVGLRCTAAPPTATLLMRVTHCRACNA